jgi:very-short-patch-repair endonuclease/predicted nucleic acid-binding Zn ribbon protein
MKRWSKLTSCKQCSNTLPDDRNVYCSDECFQTSRREQQRLKNEKHSVELVCDFCQNTFRRSKYRLNRSQGKFCNRSCASKFYKADGTYDKWTHSAKLNASGDYVICAGCGLKEVYRQPREIATDVAKCCDYKCHGLLMSKLNTGSNHPSWGKHMTEISKRKREQTLLDKYGVTCGFMRGKKMSPSKGQLSLHEKLTELDDALLPPEQLIQTDIGYFRVDALFPNQKLIVEYQGTWWHADPRKYGPDDRVGVDYSTPAQEIWERDARRKKALEGSGYAVCVIWESDWKSDPMIALESIKMELIRRGQKENCSNK